MLLADFKSSTVVLIFFSNLEFDYRCLDLFTFSSCWDPGSLIHILAFFGRPKWTCKESVSFYEYDGNILSILL